MTAKKEVYYFTNYQNHIHIRSNVLMPLEMSKILCF